MFSKFEQMFTEKTRTVFSIGATFVIGGLTGSIICNPVAPVSLILFMFGVSTIGLANMFDWLYQKDDIIKKQQDYIANAQRLIDECYHCIIYWERHSPEDRAKLQEGLKNIIAKQNP